MTSPNPNTGKKGLTLQLIWKHGKFDKKIIPLMGGFHQLLVLQKIIYRRHACIGYKKWFVDSKIMTSGSVDKTVEGRHYYRFMRVHKEAFDAIVQARIESITNSYSGINSALLNAVIDFRHAPSRNKIDSILQMNEFQSLQKNIVSTSGTKSQMTFVYLKDISLLLSMVFAAREQNLDLYLKAEREILKLLHVHYSRCNTHSMYSCDEKRTNSDIYKDLVEHGYTASITGDTFSAVHGDLITEWFNKQTKGKDGPFRSGYSTKLSAVNTYIRTMHIHAQLHREMKSKLVINTSSSHKDLSPRAMKRHKTHVNDLKETMTKLYDTDLFSDGPAMSISSGTEIDPGIISGLLGAKDMGNKCHLDFVTTPCGWDGPFF